MHNGGVLNDPETAKAKRMRRLGALAIIFITLCIYLPAIRGGYIWDDPEHVVSNPNLRSLAGLRDTWIAPLSLPQWYPLVHTTFWIEYHLWGTAPLGYHLDNVLLHIVSALLVWRIVNFLKLPGGWLAAMIFAVHPIEVESVAWISERKNCLSGVLYLAAVLAYLKFDSSENRRLYFTSIVLFLAALLSKTVTATFPAALLVILWWKHGRLTKRDWIRTAPLFVLGIIFGLVTAYLEQHHVGADNVRELQIPPIDRLLIAGRVICFYAGKLFWPHPLVFIYPRWAIDPSRIWQWVFPIGIIIALALLFVFRKSIGRGPLAAALLFIGTLFPALGFIKVYPMRFSFVADHFQYLAGLALIVPVAGLLWQHARKIGFALLAPLVVLTLLQTPVYTDAETLWWDTLAHNQNSWMVCTNLARVLQARGEATGNPDAFDQAELLFQRALSLAPEIHDTHANVGMMYGFRGRYPEAIAEFEKAIKINSQFAPAYYGIGRVHIRMGDFAGGESFMRQAIAIFPTYPEANEQLATALVQQGKIEESLAPFRVAAGAMPDDKDVRFDLGNALIQTRHFDEAAYNFREAIRIDPRFAEAWLRLGIAQRQLGRLDEAKQSFQTALALNPQLSQQILHQ